MTRRRKFFLLFFPWKKTVGEAILAGELSLGEAVWHARNHFRYMRRTYPNAMDWSAKARELFGEFEP